MSLKVLQGWATTLASARLGDAGWTAPFDSPLGSSVLAPNIRHVLGKRSDRFLAGSGPLEDPGDHWRWDKCKWRQEPAVMLPALLAGDFGERACSPGYEVLDPASCLGDSHM